MPAKTITIYHLKEAKMTSRMTAVCNYLIMIIEFKITIIIVYLYFCLVAVAVVFNYDDVLFFSFCFCLLLLLLLLFVCLLVCLYVPFFPFAKLVLFRFPSWFSISLTCSIYIHVTFFLYISSRLYKYFLLYSS